LLKNEFFFTSLLPPHPAGSCQGEVGEMDTV